MRQVINLYCNYLHVFLELTDFFLICQSNKHIHFMSEKIIYSKTHRTPQL